MVNDYLSDSAYDDLVKEASKDTRVGKHKWFITSVRLETWEDGRPRIKILGTLTTAGNAKADLTLSDIPPPEVVKAESAGWDAKKKRAIAQAISIQRNLMKHYSKKPDTIQEGDEFNVETVKNKEGFVRIAMILAPGDIKGAVPGSAASDPVPF